VILEKFWASCAASKAYALDAAASIAAPVAISTHPLNLRTAVEGREGIRGVRRFPGGSKMAKMGRWVT